MLMLFSVISYGFSSILVWGAIFENQRNWIKKHSKFLGDLFSCMLCTSTWVGFFMSLTLGGLTNHYFNVPWYMCMFFDGMYSAGSVWALNSIIEWFEENRPK